MANWLYDITTTMALPVAAAYMAVSRKHRPLLGRIATRPPQFSEPPIWVHACSVGEFAVAKTLITALRDVYPDQNILLSVSTISGREQADAWIAGIGTSGTSHQARLEVAWYPLDHRWCVGRFLDAAHPRVLVLIETELWPNAIAMSSSRGIPIVLVNGRISDKHLGRYQRAGAMVRQMLSRLTMAGVQSQLYADRIAGLGMEPSRIQVTGNLKFEGVATEIDPQRLAAVRSSCGLPADSETVPVLVFGSTRPGDEQLAAACWRTLRRDWPEMRLVVAPRHIQRADEAESALGEPVLRRSAVASQRGENAQASNGDTEHDRRVILVDTLGELITFYGLAAIAVVGGSFYPGVQGHNPIEPAALGIPVVFGPYMRNFADAAEVLVEAGAAVQVAGPEQLTTALAELLRDPDRRATMGQNGRDTVLANRGALTRTLSLLAPYMSRKAASEAATPYTGAPMPKA